MVDVEDREAQIQTGGKVTEDVEEADGIGATGDSDSDAIAGGEHAMAFDGADDAGEHDAFIVGLDTIKTTAWTRLSGFMTASKN